MGSEMSETGNINSRANYELIRVGNSNLLGSSEELE